ncbi:hypothetical protein NDK47_16280 [Brevibacillus ruminantium]|uniref:Uncharacterized protein n=1 Tax=Brevibacillus ruminantium TaxID=2950604 RepID=A0ABY4W9X8_9BACL|nr:hypothetical protein [Brevibacillus ruminantium]USG63729.1 hypothetical protein NDK47_16280 [Brevibacillus ruminantium]
MLDLTQHHGENFEQAIREGYANKFSTKNGTKFLVKQKFGLIDGADHETRKESLEGLNLKDDEVDWLRSALSRNWEGVVEEQQDSGKKTIAIRLARL